MQGKLQFEISRTPPPVEIAIPRHTNASSREPTGGQTRFEEAEKRVSSRWVERGNALRLCGQTNPHLDSRQTTLVPQPRQVSTARRVPTRAVRKERASLASSCSNPCRDDRAKSRAWSYSTASLAHSSSGRRSRTHTPSERRQSPPTKVTLQYASQPR